MTTVILFDWFNTLADYHPPRAEIHADACRAVGIEVPKEKLAAGILLADHYYVDQNSRSPIKERPVEEQIEIFARMERIALKKAGVDASDDVALDIMQHVVREFSSTRFVLFGDVLPAFGLLKERGLTLGIISNIDHDLMPVCQEIGLAPYVDVIVTSHEVGSEKPQAPIFLAALNQAGAGSSEAIYVGDHYATDVVGAQRVGMKGVLLDRHDLFGEITTCPRIGTLAEIVEHL